MEENKNLEEETTTFLTDPAKISSPNSDELKILDEFEEQIKEFNPLYRQIFVSSGVLLGVICNGMLVGFSAILLPQLLEKESPIKVTQDEESLIASILFIALAIGTLIGGWLMQKIGRKISHILTLLILLLGWMLIYSAQSFQIIILGRCICGFSVGCGGPCGIALIAETSHPKYRGFFLAGISLSVCGGLLIEHVLGTVLHWRTTCLIALGFNLLSLLMTFPIPDTYVWYSNKNKIEEARKAFYWYRGYNSEAKDEFRKFICARKQKSDLSWRELFLECKKRTFLKPLLIMNIFFLLMQFTGTNTVKFYTVSIMQDSLHNINSYAAMLIIDFLRFIISVLACFLSKRYRVRLLTIISGLGSAASLYLLAIAIYFAKLNPENKILGIISLVMLLSYIIFVTIGLLQIPWTILGEIFPPLTKGIGAGLSTCVNYFAGFTVVQTGLYLFSGLGSSGAYTFYGSCTLCGTIVLYFILPETKGKTLTEIEEGFMKKTSDNAIINN